MKWVWFLIALAIGLPFLQLDGLHLIDLTAPTPPEGVRLEMQFQRILFEPFAGLAMFFFSIKDSTDVVIIVFLLIGLVPAMVCFRLKRTLRSFMVGLLSSWLGFISIVFILLVSPLPTVRLHTPPGWLKVDFHSHTWHSHDGVASPRRNLNFHKRMGFDCFFITEHYITEHYSEFTEYERQHTVFQGVETRSTEGFNFLILGNRAFSETMFQGADMEELICIAHEQGFLVICPHSLKKSNWKQYEEMDIDGFELFDTADPGFDLDAASELRDYCLYENLAMIGASDYHGWCDLGDVWTLIPNTGNTPVTSEGILNHLRNRDGSRVILMRWPVKWFAENSLLAAMERAVRYFGSLNYLQSGSWVMYLLVLIGLNQRYDWRQIMSVVAPLVFLVFLMVDGYLIHSAYSINPGSRLLNNVLVPISTALTLIWLSISWRFRSLARDANAVEVVTPATWIAVPAEEI